MERREIALGTDVSGASATRPRSAGLVAALLRPFVEVEPSEVVTALLLTTNVFLLLTAYYFLKVAREPLILLGGGAEVKSYAAVAQSVILVFATSAYSWLSSRVSRIALVVGVTLFFVSNLVVFWALGERGVPLGVPFFLWVGIFNLTAVAQFWSFAADIYKNEQGRRLFPLIGIGSSVGAVAGAWIADKLLFVGPFGLMLLAAGVLLLTLGLTYVVHRREQARTSRLAAPEPIGRESGFALVLKDPYLLVFAALMLVLNCATKTGDYVFDRTILAAAHNAHLATTADAMHFVGQLRARYFEWTNAGGVLLQLFVVSRVIKHLGVRAALTIIPAVSLVGYGAAFAMPLLGTLFAVRVAEMSLDYSLSNTTRQALWLVTPRDAKYKAKQVIDTFVVRAGDAASAAMVWVSAHAHLDVRVLLGVNLALTGVWCVAAVYLGRAYAARVLEAAPPGAEPAHV